MTSRPDTGRHRGMLGSESGDSMEPRWGCSMHSTGRSTSPRSDERGASAVEFALICSLLFILVFGIIQFGFALNRTQGLQAGAREGARAASVGNTQADVADRVRTTQSLFTGTDINIKIEYSTNNGGGWAGTNGGTICDDSGSTHCTSTTTPTPCGQAGLGNLIRVTATVPSSVNKYAIVIPLWGSAHITYESQGVFRCENSGG